MNRTVPNARGRGSRVISRPCGSSFNANDAAGFSPSGSATYTPSIPSGFDWARSITPARHPAATLH